LQRGVPIREAAGFLGISPEVPQDTNGHHHPDYLQGAAAAIGRKTGTFPVLNPVLTREPAAIRTKKPMISG
jgi:hypothetical protein